MDTITQLLTVVGAYRDATGLSDSRISTLFFGAGHRLKTIRAGGDIGARQANSIIAAMAARWPEGREWPLGIPRPLAEVEAPEAAE